MWNYLVRQWRVEAALWVCYWNALDRDDRPSIRYCADHSLLLSVFWLAVLIGGLCWSWGRLFSFCREAVGDAGSFFMAVSNVFLNIFRQECEFNYFQK